MAGRGRGLMYSPRNPDEKHYFDGRSSFHSQPRFDYKVGRPDPRSSKQFKQGSSGSKHPRSSGGPHSADFFSTDPRRGDDFRIQETFNSRVDRNQYDLEICGSDHKRIDQTQQVFHRNYSKTDYSPPRNHSDRNHIESISNKGKTLASVSRERYDERVWPHDCTSSKSSRESHDSERNFIARQASPNTVIIQLLDELKSHKCQLAMRSESPPPRFLNVDGPQMDFASRLATYDQEIHEIETAASSRPYIAVESPDKKFNLKYERSPEIESDCFVENPYCVRKSKNAVFRVEDLRNVKNSSPSNFAGRSSPPTNRPGKMASSQSEYRIVRYNDDTRDTRGQSEDQETRLVSRRDQSTIRSRRYFHWTPERSSSRHRHSSPSPSYESRKSPSQKRFESRDRSPTRSYHRSRSRGESPGSPSRHSRVSRRSSRRPRSRSRSSNRSRPESRLKYRRPDSFSPSPPPRFRRKSPSPSLTPPRHHRTRSSPRSRTPDRRKRLRLSTERDLTLDPSPSYSQKMVPPLVSITAPASESDSYIVLDSTSPAQENRGSSDPRIRRENVNALETNSNRTGGTEPTVPSQNEPHGSRVPEDPESAKIRSTRDECVTKREKLIKELLRLQTQQADSFVKQQRVAGEKEVNRLDVLIVENAKLQKAIATRVRQLEKSIKQHSAALKEDFELNYPGNEIRCQYFDPEYHWCSACETITDKMDGFLLHLHSSLHETNLMSQGVPSFPWHKRNRVSETSAGDDSKRIPYRGLAFLQPVRALYCQLCDVWCGDIGDARLHLESGQHNANYLQYVIKNPNWEMNQTTKRQAALKKLANDNQETAEDKTQSNVVLEVGEDAKTTNLVSERKRGQLVEPKRTENRSASSQKTEVRKEKPCEPNLGEMSPGEQSNVKLGNAATVGPLGRETSSQIGQKEPVSGVVVDNNSTPEAPIESSPKLSQVNRNDGSKTCDSLSKPSTQAAVEKVAVELEHSASRMDQIPAFSEVSEPVPVVPKSPLASGEDSDVSRGEKGSPVSVEEQGKLPNSPLNHVPGTSQDKIPVHSLVQDLNSLETEPTSAANSVRVIPNGVQIDSGVPESPEMNADPPQTSELDSPSLQAIHSNSLKVGGSLLDEPMKPNVDIITGTGADANPGGQGLPEESRTGTEPLPTDKNDNIVKVSVHSSVESEPSNQKPNSESPSGNEESTLVSFGVSSGDVPAVDSPTTSTKGPELSVSSDGEVAGDELATHLVTDGPLQLDSIQISPSIDSVSTNVPNTPEKSQKLPEIPSPIQEASLHVPKSPERTLEMTTGAPGTSGIVGNPSEPIVPATVIPIESLEEILSIQIRPSLANADDSGTCRESSVSIESSSVPESAATAGGRSNFMSRISQMKRSKRTLKNPVPVELSDYIGLPQLDSDEEASLT